MPELIRLPQVKSDIIDLATFVGRDDERVAARFIAAVEMEFARINEFPGIGGPMEPIRPWMKDLRIWPIRGFENYLIIYRERQDLVEIAYVVYGSRDFATLPRRLR